jgi:lipopolysaccharide export LptBFGC system permease protein LptF
MNLNIPVAALALVGVILAATGAMQGNFVSILFGVLVILFAWILQEASKRRPS